MKFCTRLVLGSRQGIRLLRLFEAKILRGGFGITAKRTERTERAERNCAPRIWNQGKAGNWAADKDEQLVEGDWRHIERNLILPPCMA
jgi:hypothetical protein